MTIEIRELVIEARVSAQPGRASSASETPALAQTRMDEERLITRIMQRVIERLREEQERVS